MRSIAEETEIYQFSMLTIPIIKELGTVHSNTNLQ
jgi:hypothetical protein